ncbi:ComF family protein [Anaerovibrio sp.]|uniref:ComF family protein n=1 Tax=Anaerovibrio sp. TaxID=1872532 RepID=UPI0025EFDC29|nr:ComF family protein [Anaerovibrio sp.]
MPLESDLGGVFDKGVWCLGEYDGILKKLIADVKYNKKKSAIKAVQYFTKKGMEKLEMEDTELITAVPLYESKMKARGFNQGVLLFSPAVSARKMDFSEVLKRVRDTIPQFNLKYEERQKNVRGAFALQEDYVHRIKGKNILLTDDIFTTGATFFECGKELKKAGAASILGVVIASGRK